jgi:hypothetical protein
MPLSRTLLPVQLQHPKKIRIIKAHMNRPQVHPRFDYLLVQPVHGANPFRANETSNLQPFSYHESVDSMVNNNQDMA